jgi:hypothetical protein
LVEVRFGRAHRLEQELHVDRRHAPDDSLDGAAVQGAVGQLSGGERGLGFHTGFRFFLLGGGRDAEPAEEGAGGEQGRGQHRAFNPIVTMRNWDDH